LSAWSPKGVIFPFVTVTLIWSSTWIVIRDQLGVVPAGWSVAYRVAIAAIGMAVVARIAGASLNIGRRGLLFAAALGLAQFTLNFNLVYRAEAHLTSGLVALVYALLMIPNSLLVWALFKERISPAFLIGSIVAIAGVGLLFLNEYRMSATASPQDVLFGVGITSLGMLCASSANVMQASPFARTLPMASVLTWAMGLGALADAALAWATVGPPVIEPRLGYWLGTLYLALAGSVVTFPLYFSLIQRIGAGPAAYTSVLIPILAMAISTVAEDYRWTPVAALGVALALGGMVIALRARLRRQTGR
jgi:drug/metabolite transporter (DMT)-like permease